MLELNLGVIDLAVLGLYLTAAVLLGLWVGRGQRDLSSYFLGGRNVPWWAVLGSIVATETSTATFLSVPGIAFAKETGDLRFLQLAMGYILGRTVIVFLLLPLFFRGTLFTAYQVLQERFGGDTKRIASLIFLVTRNLGDGLRLFLTAIALKEVVGWPLAPCVIAIGIATIIYTVFGGMKSVVWNDCIQMVIYMTGGLLAGVVILSALPEGWNTFVSYGQQYDKFQLIDLRFDASEAYTLWAGVLGGMFLTLGTHGTDQMMVQRYLCARSQRDAGRALILSSFVVFLQFALFLLLGVGLACYYDVVRPEMQFTRSDRVFASFIVHEMPRNVGLIGLLLAAVFAAAMSTLSSSLNSSASAVVNDFLVGSSGTNAGTSLVLGRGLTVVFGVVQILIGIAAERFSQNVVSDALAVAGFSAGLLLGVFCLGVLTRRVDQRSCLVGLTFGLVVLLSVQFVWPRYGWSIAWPWYSLIGASTTFAAGLAASFIWKGQTPRESETPGRAER